MPARAEGRLRAVRARTATPLTRIGVATKAAGCVLAGPGGETALPAGFAHFARVASSTR